MWFLIENAQNPAKTTKFLLFELFFQISTSSSPCKFKEKLNIKIKINILFKSDNFICNISVKYFIRLRKVDFFYKKNDHNKNTNKHY